jgi:hypothetical protein
LERRSSMAKCLRWPPPPAAFGCSGSGSIRPPALDGIRGMVESVEASRETRVPLIHTSSGLHMKRHGGSGRSGSGGTVMAVAAAHAIRRQATRGADWRVARAGPAESLAGSPGGPAHLLPACNKNYACL